MTKLQLGTLVNILFRTQQIIDDIPIDGFTTDQNGEGSIVVPGLVGALADLLSNEKSD
jgi:hypothetical protein